MSDKIISYKGYVAGWLDTSIHDFLNALPVAAVSTKYALITCLDSNPDPASLLIRSPELKHIRDKCHIAGSGLLLPTNLLFQTDSDNQLFFGFDEVWFFPNRRIRPKPSTGSLVGPARTDRATLQKLGTWMTDNSCTLGLGGGEGLNFVVKAHGLVRFLLGYSIEQPEANLAAT